MHENLRLDIVENPKIQFNPKDIVANYGKSESARATGVLTMAADLLLGKIKANKDVCAKILKTIDSQDLNEDKKFK